MRRGTSWVLGIEVLFLALCEQAVWAEQTIARLNGKFPEGGVATHEFLVDPCAQLKLTVIPWLSPEEASVEAVFVDPNERHINFHIPPSDPSIRVHEPLVLSKKGTHEKGTRSLLIENPPTGRWMVRLRTSAAKPASQYVVTVTAEGAHHELIASHVLKTIQPGEPVSIEASLIYDGRPVPEASVAAQVSSFGYPKAIQEQRLVLYDDETHGDRVPGDGVYTTTITPERAGEIDVRLHATDGHTFERTDAIMFHVSRQGARIVRGVSDRGVDQDSDGHYESLEVVAEVEVTDAEGQYRLKGMLTDVNGKLVEPPLVGGLFAQQVQRGTPGVYANVPHGAGVYQVSLFFPGSEIRGSHKDGPYLVHLAVEDSAIVGYPFGALQPPHQTQPYRWQNFEAQ